MKTCYLCGDPHPLTEFHNSKTTPDGKVGGCKTCVNALKRANDAKHRARRKAESSALVTVKVPCCNAADGCDQTRDVMIAKGDRPPRKLCDKCRTMGAPGERNLGLEEFRKRHGGVGAGHVPTDDWGGSLSVVPKGGHW